ncbi:uncharacterized protein [Montipora capricornis]|uniref:uncharacterized protein isoform X1 n=2 Tax=Montipora capricornis TaxID=246305 RepID=UPI0035F178DF
MYVPALLVLAILRCLDFSEAGISYQTGKLNMSQTFQHWSCSRACSLPPSCRLPRCTNVQFPRPFGGSSNIRVYVSMSHGEKFIQVHSPSSVWVQSINTSGFEICAREAGIDKNESGIVNWLAFQDQLQLSHGSVALSGIWTTETKCNKVTFTQSFASRPYVFISAKYFRNTKPEDAMYVWLENLSSRGFEVCLREFLAFDGKHQDTIVDWFAFVGNGSEFNFTRAGETFFPNNGTPGANENYGFCKQVQFKTTFYVPPVVLISVHHQYNGPFIHHILPGNNIITAWVEEISIASMTVCVKDLSGAGSTHDPLHVSYILIGDLDPCLDVKCPSFGVCKTYSAHVARCVCFEDCPSYQDPVCTSNGTTYDNKCWHELNYCKGLDNSTIYHPGSCEGFPMERGRTDLVRVPKWTDSTCETVTFPPYRFYPDKQVHVQVSVNHMTLNDSATVHDAVTSWTENVNTKNFTVCVMQAGRNKESLNPFATVDWLAYQGAPPEGMTGTIKLQKWWSGTKCADVIFPRGKFNNIPVVQVTAEHGRVGNEYDSSLVWIEDATKASFKVCLREMQNFDGQYEDIYVSWLAISNLHKPYFAEYGSVGFPNTHPPLDEKNNAYCKFVEFQRSYETVPTVLISANHSTTISGNLAPEHNGITTWIEDMNPSGFRVCVKEFWETRYDPVSLSYVVLTDICDPGWSYFGGFCYFTSDSCSNWTTALAKCRSQNSVLVDVGNNEENVYIQHRHNGEKSWLGLNDISTEGNFGWADRGNGNFTAWAKNQPNNFGDEDCVHTLGVKYNYEWNDVKCSNCYPYTCKKDLDECGRKTHSCDQHANCTNEYGAYRCACDSGYVSYGYKCRPRVITSCSEVRKYVGSASGNFVIDPDGVGGLAPFTVYCDMTDKNGIGVTVISHDSERRTYVQGCESAGCYSRDIHYIGASLSQLAMLTRVSSHCEQFIEYECYGSSFWFGGPYGFWVSHDSKKMAYWGGASPGSAKCACGMTGSCASHSHVCNCDQNDYVWREDSGLLTDKRKLPVKQLRFGDTGGSREKGYHTLGKFKCYGTA